MNDDKIFINPNEDVVRRGQIRALPCKLTDEEFVRISRARVAREAERNQLVDDLANETKRRKDQIKEAEDEIGKMGRELHTGYQDRAIKCNDVFRREEDGTGVIITVRLDTCGEVERRPASPAELQRHLPSIPEGGLLSQARTAQAAEATAAPASAEDDDVPGDEGAPPVATAGDAEASSDDEAPVASEDQGEGEGEEQPKKRRRGRS